MRFIPISLLLVFAATGCSAPAVPVESEVLTETLPSTPSENPAIESIAILGTNDIHGTLLPIRAMTREFNGATPVEYEAGGAALIAHYVRALRGEWGNRLLWLDGGDEFQGSLESNTQLGKPMVEFFNALGLSAAAIGNHEFDWGVPALWERMKEAKYPYLAANIHLASDDSPAKFPNTHASLILNAGRARIGVIGLSTLDTPKTTRPENVKAYRFKSLADATLREARLLREKGAHAIVIVSHVGTRCPVRRKTGAYAIFQEGEEGSVCQNPEEELDQLLEQIPPGTVDAVVSGHSHSIVHHWVHGVPVIQSGHQGRYLHVVYLAVDTGLGKVERSRTRIEGPIPVCSRVFRNQRDCNGDAPAPPSGRGGLVTSTFHGKPVRPDGATLALLSEATDVAQHEGARVVGQTELRLEHLRQEESPLGNLVADAIRESANADFALINGGGIRAPIEKGEISFGSVFRTLPFENAVVTVEVTGRELERILRVAESGARGFAPVSGLHLRLLRDIYKAKGEDLDGDGQISPWEFKTLTQVTDTHGTKLDPNRLYRLATIDFLTNGGDDMKWPFAQIASARFQLEGGLTMRDALLQYLKVHSPISTIQMGRFEWVNQIQGRKRSGSNAKRHRRKN